MESQVASEEARLIDDIKKSILAAVKTCLEASWPAAKVCASFFQLHWITLFKYKLSF